MKTPTPTPTLRLAFFSLALFAGLSAAAAAAPVADAPSNDDGAVSWFEALRNATCTGFTDGHIKCQPGVVEELLKGFQADALQSRAIDTQAHMNPNSPKSNTDADGGMPMRMQMHAEMQAQADTEAGTKRIAARAAEPPTTPPTPPAPPAQEETCTGEGAARALECFAHCLGAGFCNAGCDAQDNTCRCSCADAAGPKGPGVPCEKATC